MHTHAPATGQVGKTVHLLGTLITFRATAAETGGSFSLVEAATAPGQGTPPHLQREDDEAFYILEGTYEFLLDGESTRASAGDFVYVPRGKPHGFWNRSAETARMLIINVPGGLHENFFAEAGDAVADSSTFPPVTSPDVPRLLAAASRYGIEMLPPQ